ILKKEGFAVSSASNIIEGMAKLLKDKPQLIILDVMMDQPDDGFVMAQDIRAKGIRTPILMLTSVGKALGISFGKDKEMLPVDEFQEKPLDPKILVKKVKALIEKAKEA
ncbi:MAG: response regulator, partial [Candidatus Brocadiia bacterium]